MLSHILLDKNLTIFVMDIRAKIVFGTKNKSDTWITLFCGVIIMLDILFHGSHSTQAPQHCSSNKKKVNLLSCSVAEY